jgi:precorrin-6A/cobalt-precorrin-6A reductase
MKILILGGTREAKLLAKKIINSNVEIIYSIAGLVRQPELDCKVISGGFSQYYNESGNVERDNNERDKTDINSGLSQYLLTENIDCLVDATHPFATKMSQQANQSAHEVNIPYISFVRPEWEAQAGDDWSLLENEHQLLNELALAINAGSQKIFYTNGQIDRKLAVKLDAIAELNEAFGPAQFIVRSAKETELPQYAQWIQAISPFNIDDEKALLEQYDIDLIVTKNSGGEATKAKLEAARELGIRVLMLQRPKIVNDSNNRMNKIFNNLDECFEFINKTYSGDCR